jgi:two-component system, NtrC family, nitrogen regulation response regulator GlnG
MAGLILNYQCINYGQNMAKKMITVLIAKDEEKVRSIINDMLSRDNPADDLSSLQERVVELGEEIFRQKRGTVYKTVLEIIEKPLLEQALARTEGNQLKAARILGINRNTMRTKIKKFGIDANKWKVFNE